MRASTFHPPTVEMLYALGVGEEAVAKGLKVDRVQYRDRRTKEVAEFNIDTVADETSIPFRLQLEQWEFCEIGHAALGKYPNVDIRMHHRLSYFEEHAEGVTVHVEAPDKMTKIEASFVVGADGAHSTVRKILDIPFSGFRYDERFLVCSTDFQFEEVFDNLSWVNYVSDPDEWCVILRTNRNWRVLFPVTDASMTDKDVVGDTFVQERLQHLHPRKENYVTLHRSLYEVHQRVADSFYKGRCVLVGDACHVHNPLGGMGMNGGCHDAWMVGMKLVAILKLGANYLTEFADYDLQRRELAQKDIQRYTIENKKQMESMDPDVQKKRQADFMRKAQDPKLHKEYVFERQMLRLVRESFRVAHQREYLAMPHADKPLLEGGAIFGTSLGLGRHPALIVVDFCNAYTDPASPMYCPDPVCGVVRAVDESVEVLAAAREHRLPVVFTRVVYEQALDLGVFKAKVPQLTTWTGDAKGTQICAQLTPQQGETVMVKQYPSAFFGTPLAANLTAAGVDSVILIGCSTSGCIRASALDAMQHGFKVTVVAECVGDRTRAVHDANLFDIRAKIGDVTPKAQVLKRLGQPHFTPESRANGVNGVSGINGVKNGMNGAHDATDDAKRPDGMGYVRGERDFQQNRERDAKVLKYDFDSPMKEFTNGIVAPNAKREFTGCLTGRRVRVPDVNSGYPKCKTAPVGNSSPGDVEWLDLSNGGFKDHLCSVKKFMVVVPSTNTTVEADFWRMIHANKDLDGIGFHSSPILISSPKLASDDDMLEFLRQFRKEILHTIDVGMTAEPEYIVMGMSLETFFGGWEGNREFIEEIGCEVAVVHGLKCGSATDIAHVPSETLEPVLRDLAAWDGVQAVVQCGTNLSCVGLMDRLEAELGVAMVPINAATLWFALRENGINAPIPGACRLCREF
jgi:3-(3-hydroxy-phenyl)propionate hydroxylase